MSNRPLALVTGASSGIGEHLARQLGRAGYEVVLLARRRSRRPKRSCSFSQALGAELWAHRISVTALCPGPTESEFITIAGAQRARLFQSLTSPSEVAAVGLEAMQRGRAVAIVGLTNRLLAWFGRFVPARLLVRVSARLMVPA